MEVDHVNRLGWTALHEAIILGDGSQRYVDTVRELVAGRADVELAPCGDNVSPTAHGQSHGVCRSGHHPRGGIGPVHEPSHSEAEAGRRLLTAAESGDADAVALALRAGAPIEQRDEQGRTALLLAATFDRVKVARALVALGADPNALDERHDTPWLVTGVTGSVAMLEALLPAHPNLAIRNRFGGLSVIPASERGHVDYLRRVSPPVSTSITSTTWGGRLCSRLWSLATARSATRRSSASCLLPEPTRQSATAAAPRPSTMRAIRVRRRSPRSPVPIVRDYVMTMSQAQEDHSPAGRRSSSRQRWIGHAPRSQLGYRRGPMSIHGGCARRSTLFARCRRPVRHLGLDPLNLDKLVGSPGSWVGRD